MECYYDSLFEVECEGINALKDVPCLGGFGVTSFARGWRGELGMHVTPFSERFKKRLEGITECASVNEFYLWNFFYWRDKVYKFFVEVTSIWIPEKRGELWTYKTVRTDKHKCYYLGQFPLHWDPINQTVFSPSLFGNPGSHPISGGASIPDEYFPETHKQEIEELYTKYGASNMLKWSQPNRLTPMQKKAFMEDVEQPDGTWKPSTYSQIEADMSGMLVSYKRKDLESYVGQDYYLRIIDKKYKDCIKKEYPGQKL